MKKYLALLMVGTMAFSLAACGKSSNGAQDSQQTQEQTVEQTQEPTQTQESLEPDNSGMAGNGDFSENTEGFSEEMTALREAVVNELGEDYWPSSQVPAEALESLYGLSPDMYVDYMGEMPLMSTQVDTLLIVKAAEGQADAVEAALQAYRTDLVENSVQYPMNVGKVQGSTVERIGDYVCLLMLGGDVFEVADQGDEAVIKRCQEHNQRAIEAIKAQIGQ